MTLLLNPTATAQWHALVTEAQQAADQHLEENLESYLVFLLMRFMTQPEMTHRVMALEFLESLVEYGRLRQMKLRDVGDQCLIFSGLFPQQAERRRVKVSYFVDLGRSAYQTLSDNDATLASLYGNLADSFVDVMDVLQAMRSLQSSEPLLNPMTAFELWSDTGSKQALQSLRKISTGTPVAIWSQDEGYSEN